MKFFHKKGYGNAAAVIVVCAGAAALCLLLFIGFGSKNGPSYVSLSNFKPGAKVAYEIFDDTKLVEKGFEEVDTSGKLKLESPLMEDRQTQGQVAVNLKIEDMARRAHQAEEGSDSVNLLLKMDKKSRKIDYFGSGLDDFSRILVSNGKDSLETNADWSGGFAGDNLFDKLDDKNRKLLKLAFQSHDLQDDSGQPEHIVEVFFGDPNGSSAAAVQARYTAALIMMTEQLSAVMMQQAFIIGTFFDAKMQLETQRKIQELMARAHKDYHPSEQICRFGTFVKSLAHSERAYELDMRALNRALMNQMLAVQDDSSTQGPRAEVENKITQFQTKYCNPRDNNDSLDLLCPTLVAAAPAQRIRFNKDIDYFRTVDSKLTLDANFSDATLTNEEEDLFALAQNLYFPDAFDDYETVDVTENPRSHYNTRAFAARMNAAQNSFINIVGMKTSSPPGQATVAPGAWPPNIIAPPPPATPLTENTGWTFMKAFIRELGLPAMTNAEIHEYLGERPSYYAQMEVLTKKIYQSPHFYTNLYDKPANVDRIGAAIDAIALMSLRDRFDSSLRREILTSLLVEDALEHEVENVTVGIYKNVQDEQPTVRP